VIEWVVDGVFNREVPAEAFGDLFSSAHTGKAVTKIWSRNDYGKAG